MKVYRKNYNLKNVYKNKRFNNYLSNYVFNYFHIIDKFELKYNIINSRKIDRIKNYFFFFFPFKRTYRLFWYKDLFSIIDYIALNGIIFLYRIKDIKTKYFKNLNFVSLKRSYYIYIKILYFCLILSYFSYEDLVDNKKKNIFFFNNSLYIFIYYFKNLFKTINNVKEQKRNVYSKFFTFYYKKILNIHNKFNFIYNYDFLNFFGNYKISNFLKHINYINFFLLEFLLYIKNSFFSYYKIYFKKGLSINMNWNLYFAKYVVNSDKLKISEEKLGSILNSNDLFKNLLKLKGFFKLKTFFWILLNLLKVSGYNTYFLKDIDLKKIFKNKRDLNIISIFYQFRYKLLPEVNFNFLLCFLLFGPKSEFFRKYINNYKSYKDKLFYFNSHDKLYKKFNNFVWVIFNASYSNVFLTVSTASGQVLYKLSSGIKDIKLGQTKREKLDNEICGIMLKKSFQKKNLYKNFDGIRIRYINVPSRLVKGSAFNLASFSYSKGFYIYKKYVPLLDLRVIRKIPYGHGLRKKKLRR